MLAALKSKQFAYVLAGLAFAISFFIWQNKREVTKQLAEKTAQLKHIMENPVIKTVEGPVRIVQGKTIVREIIREIKADGSEVVKETETITDPTITEKGPTIIEKDFKDPIGEAEAKKRKFMVFGGYSFDERAYFGMGMTLFNRVNFGTIINYDIKNKQVFPGLQIAVLF